MGRNTPSPLRYPGGKIRLANFMKQIIIDNDLVGGDYIEVYAGGASIAWSLLLDNYVNTVYINDINKSISAFWYSVFNETEALCRLIRDTPVTIQSWKKQKAIQKASSNSSNLELGFSTLFLNRTNRSGIIGGGIIGGLNQAGLYKINARYKKAELISKIEKLASYKSKVRLYSIDASQFIKTVIPTISQRSLMYLDPPYYSKGADLYENHYDHDGHVAVANTLKTVNRNWIISYDNVPKIRAMYKGYKRIVYKLSYSVLKQYSGSEIIFFSPKLSILKKKSPLLFDKPKTKQLYLQLEFPNQISPR